MYLGNLTSLGTFSILIAAGIKKAKSFTLEAKFYHPVFCECVRVTPGKG